MDFLRRDFAVREPLLVGILAGFPQVFGAGYGFMDQAMHSQYTWQVLGIIAGLKILATNIVLLERNARRHVRSYSFHWRDAWRRCGYRRTFLLSEFNGLRGHLLFGGNGGSVRGFLRVPITSVFMALEVSGDYTIVLAVLVANMFSYMISRKFQPVPALEQITRQDGLYLPALEEEREQEVLTVEDAMRPRPAVILDSQKPARDAWNLIDGNPTEYFLVRRPSNSIALSSRADLKRLVDSGDPRPLEETQILAMVPYLHPDEDLQVALRQATNYPLVPVLSRANVSRILGVIDLDDIMKAYRQPERQHQDSV